MSSKSFTDCIIITFQDILFTDISVEWYKHLHSLTAAHNVLTAIHIVLPEHTAQ